MENDSFNPDGSLYDPFHDPILIKRSHGDSQLLKHLAEVELARLNQERIFGDHPEATDEEREAARARLSEQKNELHAYMSERGYVREVD